MTIQKLFSVTAKDQLQLVASNFCMERSDFDYGANWLLVGAKWLRAKWPLGEMTLILLKSPFHTPSATTDPSQFSLKTMWLPQNPLPSLTEQKRLFM